MKGTATSHYHFSLVTQYCVRFFVTPWTAAHWASLSFTISQSLLNSCPLSQWCHPTISSSAIPSPFTFNLLSIRVFSNESALDIRWPKYWSFSFSISPSNAYSGMISFRIDWFYFLAIQGTLKTLFSAIRRHQFFGTQPSLWSNSHNHNYWKNNSIDYTDLCQQSDVFVF